MNQPDREKSPASLRWLSRDYSELRTARDRKPWDVLIVGSGYGGAMAAAELAGLRVNDEEGDRQIRVCVLERGNEYAPGMFASSLQDLPPHMRVHRSGQDSTIGPLDALLDVRMGPDVSALVGNGLGGTSLINAGVMVKPRLGDCQRLPAALIAGLTDRLFEETRSQLGAGPLALHPKVPPEGVPKARALRHLARAAGAGPDGKHVEHRFADITVQTRDDDPDVPQCTLCGDCMTGCNVGAKKSLDTTLLRSAWQQGAEIFTGGSVLKVRKGDGADPVWRVSTVYTDESLRRRHWPMDIKARHVILAAGTLGSTEILLRSRHQGLQFSEQLGEQFSCNGDNLVALHEGPEKTHTTSEEHVPLADRGVGPTITSMIDLDGLLLQEFAVPAPLKRLFDETVTTARLLNDLAKKPTRTDGATTGCDSFAVDQEAMGRTLLVGIIGHDESCGQLRLADPRRMEDRRHVEGRLSIHWPDIRNSFMLESAFDTARMLAEKARGEGTPFLPNPLWRLLPPQMEFLVKGERGPVLTVHPLGGCAMGESPLLGVVDDCGRVFDPVASEEKRRPEHHKGLIVLDGSIIPASLGANPALMIATVAKRAARLLARDWGYHAGAIAPRPLRPRPVYRKPLQCTPDKPRETKVELAERLVGHAGPHLVELTLRYQPEAVTTLMSNVSRKLQVVEDKSFIRIYKGDKKTANGLITLTESQRDDEALLVAHVGGDLDLLRQDGDDSEGRTLLAAWNWLLNRGTRELWDRWFGPPGDRQQLELGQFFASAARAAEMRCFDYTVHVTRVLKQPAEKPLLLSPRDTIKGVKRLTYGRCSNPWRQLTEMRLTAFPAALGPGVLELDGRFLAKQGFPLIRITQQENQILALAELASWGMCWARMLVSIHLWSFRAPDRAPARKRELLPQMRAGKARGKLPGLPAPQVTEIELDPPRRGIPVRIRLSRYPCAGQPVVLIHGYSASGSTFTHDAIPMPLALHLRNRGHDVWVLDLRTSAGMPSAVVPWHFEDAALADIPVAIAHIRKVTGARHVNVFAHCIGAVMFSMALLADPDDLSTFDMVDVADGGPRPRRYTHELSQLRDSIGRIVLSQKAPSLVYSDDNVARAYFMRALRRAILPDDYQFVVPAEQGVAGGLLDRILSTIPYPDEDFRRENPLRPWKRAPWAGFRHRMDALYARDFTLSNIAEQTLDAIQDLFGPLNLDTVSQAIHFARHNTITDGAGRAIDTRRTTLAARWPRKGTMSLHGVDNGLVDVCTLDVFRKHMEGAGLRVVPAPIPGYGHQDCLIGRHAATDVFPKIARFLELPHDELDVPVADPVERDDVPAK